ncbi:hypothetical protein DY000_02041361 [Brassica cretica]|uniref:Uncharacterized protein n=1 Tax=Brassica cretica TaxID=69181 RepID=A0ABQ7BRL7_BRACR|nr:hypothetical protein DY000_02041361 [Brassica cretica]
MFFFSLCRTRISAARPGLTSSVVKLLLPFLRQAPIASILSPPPDLFSPSQP